MTARTSAAKPLERADPGRCGCGKSLDECCELECLTRPRFYCGQLLTDQDLTAMVDWARERFQLQRYHDGWGIACGLNVRCDPQNPKGVIVESGYAVNCCGDDIVLCTNDRVDLSAACLPDEPCDDLSDWQPTCDPDPVDADEDETTADMMADRFDAPDAAEQGEEFAVDLFLHYDEKLADQRASLRRSECAEAPKCEPTKIVEGHRFVQTPVEADSDPGEAHAKDWCCGYNRCLDVLCRWRDGDKPQEKRDFLLRWIDEHPPTVFCDLRQMLSDLGPVPTTKGLLKILALLVVDCRIAYVRHNCRTCRRDQGIRLARIHLRRPPGMDCRVVYVDGTTPFRRALSLDPPLPASPGKINVAGVIGAPQRLAKDTLEDLGLDVELDSLDFRFSNISQLKDHLACDCGVMVERGGAVTLVVADSTGDSWLERRVLGACPVSRINGDTSDGHTHTHGQETPVRQEAEPVTEPNLAVTLQEIRGIGPKTAEALADDGITVEQVAAMDAEELKHWLPAIQHGRADEIIRSAGDLTGKDGRS